MRIKTFLRHTLTLGLLVAVSACRAGPSAFDRPEEKGPEDTADVSSLPPVPHAPDVEVLPDGEGEDAEAGEADDPDVPAPSGAVAPSPEGVDAPPVFQRPEHVRGLYVNAWAAGSRTRLEGLLDLARRTEINTFVIDIKDASGYVSYPTRIPLAREVGATEEIRIRDLPGLLRTLHREGIYPIARIVIVKDPILSQARPDMAVQDTAGGVWVDGKGILWLNLFNPDVWAYHLDLAREVVSMGFPEIQWDYVRFPDAPRSELARAVYPGQEGRPKTEAVRAFLDFTRRELGAQGVQVTADVFGVTTSAARDVGIGQVWERFIDVVDVALPMVYPSHYWQGSFGIDRPNAFPYEIVRRALEDALERSAAVEGAGLTRPWLQDFSLGQPPYGAPEVRAQIQAAYDAGVEEWVLWNPSSRYTPEALEPVGGFVEEPLIRVADRVVPVSERMALLEPEPEPGAGSASADSTARADSVGPPAPEADSAGPATPDSVGPPAPEADSVGPPAPDPARMSAPDTLSEPGSDTLSASGAAPDTLPVSDPRR